MKVNFRTDSIFLYSDIEFYPPFPAIENTIENYITYLDTTGRPEITLYYQQLTDRHVGVIYVSWD